MEIKEKEERVTWFIRYSDGKMRSFVGSREEAEKLASKEAEGRLYKII